MTKLNELLKKNGYGFLTEEDGSVLAKPQAPEQSQQPEASNNPLEQQSQETPEKQSLSPASFVTLVRLLKDAFVAKPSDEDAAAVTNLQLSDGSKDINETNAQEAFDQLLPIISKYSRTDVGVKDMLNTVN